jgi:4-hydroxy-tetrahydrodipicolinate reductase
LPLLHEEARATSKEEERMIRVGVLGAGGRMGQHVCQAVIDDPELELVAAVDPHHSGIDLDQVGIHGTGLQMTVGPQALGDADAEVAVDFTVLDAARENLEWCADHSVHAVVGTTGFTADEIEALRKRFADAGANAVIAPNFAIGAVLMMRLAELAAPFFDTAEVIELHHDNKVDAPSGTAMMTVQRIADASSDWAADPTESVVAEGARGGIGPGGIRVHSLRIRGLVAHHEVVLGTTGQSLTIRHDSYDRTSYMPGVLLAIRRVREQPGLTVGLDALLEL